MPVTINALDNEFAISSGANVNNGPGTSTFDYPPDSTSNLTITYNQGDGSPFQFSVGDSYDVGFTGNGGGATLGDAVVVRSDYVNINGDQGGAVVFEGIEAEGLACESLYFGDAARARLGSDARREIAAVFPGLLGSQALHDMGGATALQLARPALKFREARLLASLMWGIELPVEPRSATRGFIAA